jgi:RNA polymerase sigma factor (sigma-70 family)
MNQQLGAGDRDERFRALYQKYYWRVVRYFIRAFRLGEEEAKELAQDAFVRFYEAMDEYRGDAEWAFFETIARNIGYNNVRSKLTQKRNAKVVDLDDPLFTKLEPEAPADPDYGERQLQAIRRRQLYDAIASLPSGMRESVQLWLDGFKYDEVAAALRISMDAVKSRLRDAKRLLRTRLGDANVLPEVDE